MLFPFCLAHLDLDVCIVVFQCFDYMNYINTLAQSTCHCPWCGAPTREEDLELDMYVQRALHLAREQDAFTEIIFDKTGRWTKAEESFMMEGQGIV